MRSKREEQCLGGKPLKVVKSWFPGDDPRNWREEVMLGKSLKGENPCLQDMIREFGWSCNMPLREGRQMSCFRILSRRAGILQMRLTSQQAENHDPKGKITTGGT
jgi:hypothetical protein